MADGTEIAEIRKVDADSGTLYLRDGITFALFFGEPDAETAEALVFALEAFLGMLPPGALRWASVGASSESWKPFTKTTVDRCKALLSYAAMRKRDLTAFELRDGQEGGEAPGYGIALFASPDLSEDPEERNLLQMYFPASVLDGSHREGFVKSIRAIAQRLPFVSGYCSPGLHWSESHTAEALAAARKVGMRYPGFDVQFNQLGRDQLGNKIRGARWLTFLGSEITASLGGVSALRKQLPSTTKVEAAGKGTLIRASESPEIGDTNRQRDTPSLRAVARVLEPVTQFEELVLLRYDFADDNPRLLERWERRFF